MHNFKTDASGWDVPLQPSMFRSVQVAKCPASKVARWSSASVRFGLSKCLQSLKTEFPGVAAFDNAQSNSQHTVVSLGVAEKCPGIDSDLLSLTRAACSESARTHQNPLRLRLVTEYRVSDRQSRHLLAVARLFLSSLLIDSSVVI